MLKHKGGKEINPNTFIYTVPAFRLVKHYNDGIDKEYIFVRIAIENRQVFFIMINSNGQYCTYNMFTKTTFHMQWDETFTAYECEVDNIDVEYH